MFSSFHPVIPRITPIKESVMTERNKGGRPTKAEQLAKGITKSELDGGLRILKRAFGPALTRMIEVASNPELPLDKQFKMAQDIANMYMAMLRADKALIAIEQKEGEGSTDTPEPASATIFQLHG
jgi:hypothetical protein